MKRHAATDASGIAVRTPHIAAATLLGALLLWLAFPPGRLSWLAWVAPSCWLLPCAVARFPAGYRPWAIVWLAGTIHWVLMLEGIRLAHWMNYFGLALLAGYLGIYWPLFVAICRAARHRLRIPLLVAAPVIWTALEFAREYLFTGFSLGLLGHSQVSWLALIQISEGVGAYGVSFVVMLVAACGFEMVFERQARAIPARLGIAAAVLASCVGYGVWRLSAEQHDDGRTLRVALLQSSVDSQLDVDAETAAQLYQQSFDQCWTSMLAARDRHGDLDLVVWPESVFTGTAPDYLFGETVSPPPESGLSAAQTLRILQERQASFLDKARMAARMLNSGSVDATRRTALIVGADTIEFGPHPPRSFNSALLISPEGDVVDRYFKNHRVMFGEYIPFGDHLPGLYSWFPIGRGLAAGAAPAGMRVAGVTACPSICFESTVPHLIRGQVAALSRQGRSPGLLVNATNDGWFRGSAILDLQLACAVFRAVELRRPVVIAANTGISAAIAATGAIQVQAERRRVDFLVADVSPATAPTPYQRTGDWFAGACLAATVIVGISGLRLTRRTKTACDNFVDTGKVS